MMAGIGIESPEASWRYASTLGHRYVSPIYFTTRKSAEKYDQQTQQALGCLPGMTTMRIERRDNNGNWHPLGGDVQ
ncbi:MAG: hypothetical protein WBA38_04215 [Gordonia sp. (in: high G+C Gram-positive bacteria)]|uniref:hypothetical protein n=1 Tax=Gordonia sp. (in: high G+C Gram-positive bacteria) TaxID=84139 RepID=UPI003C70CCCD